MIEQYFTSGQDPYSLFNWQNYNAKIDNPVTGKISFEQADVEFPTGWSQNAINIVAQKYFWGTPGTEGRERSLKTLINRVADTITNYGQQNKYFTSEMESKVFNSELKYILTNQMAAFNSPVWFNIGAAGRSQQASACFILSVEDTMESILKWYTEEGMIFKGGSGSGINLSKLRSSYEELSGSGGKSSGPVSFMRGADSVAGTIKSGGKTRRAAKMVILNVDHPDIEEFIWCKAIEERKARALEAAGYDMTLDGKDIFSVQYQNANNSVRVSDQFMNAVLADGDWNLLSVTNNKPVKTMKARALWRQIVESAWECADPGLQFDTTINHWHTTPNAGRINGSNPCSEYMHLDDSACNLASINLLKFLKDDGSFDVPAYVHTVKIIITAQEILVGYSDYPTTKIAVNAKAFRELGMGYANLGALLMAMGLGYDSEEGRALAASLTAIMGGEAYAQSARIASRVGPFEGYSRDKDGMLRVLNLHRAAIQTINSSLVPSPIFEGAIKAWNDANELAAIYGVRNSQSTVLAPTGTIAFMMDCDTTGIEPDFSLTKFKKLVDGGTMVIINQTIPRALTKLGYNENQIKEIDSFILEKGSVVGAPHITPNHYPIFACAVGDNFIHHMGHIKMMGAVQPFLSGAISKTVNMPENSTIEDVEDLHMEAWKHGIKAVAIYRDNCKVAQPLSSGTKEKEKDLKTVESDKPELSPIISLKNGSRDLPRKRTSKTFEFKVADCKGFFTVGEFDDGTPGEIFMRVSKQGSTLAGIMDSFAISISRGLRNGVPLRSYVKDFIGMSFAPAGVTDDSDIRTATSLVDYIFRRLGKEYLSFDEQLSLGLIDINNIDMNENQPSLLDLSGNGDNKSDSKIVEMNMDIQDHDPHTEVRQASELTSETAPLCFSCGNITQRAGSCYVCTACGSTSGCS